eukprot:TRINITY_DN4068_c0_g2_i1.p1 TRINITY_DN4068_c0_g2~~TRINITY_DN4068_c0_g2_i1.p1  ORF type:complete len:103 (+),score=7.75 TRINITY_DN4068_c0_g2_i1:106-414(+)
MRTTLSQTANFVDLAYCSKEALDNLYGNSKRVGSLPESNRLAEPLNAHIHFGSYEDSDDFSSAISSDDLSEHSEENEHESKALTDDRSVHVPGSKQRGIFLV